MESMDKIASAWATIVNELGYDTEDPHLRDSPDRIARYMRNWHTIGSAPPKLTTFPNDPHVNEVVAVGGIWFYSMCAHHGLPFFGTAAIGYIPGDHVLGLSKFARVVDHFAHRFQVQERLTHDVADYLESELKPRGIGIVMRAEHLCMSARGVGKPGHSTVTSVMRGAFMESSSARAELLELIEKK
jgi:GTP cyclohydrolase I